MAKFTYLGTATRILDTYCDNLKATDLVYFMSLRGYAPLPPVSIIYKIGPKKSGGYKSEVFGPGAKLTPFN